MTVMQSVQKHVFASNERWGAMAPASAGYIQCSLLSCTQLVATPGTTIRKLKITTEVYRLISLQINIGWFCWGFSQPRNTTDLRPWRRLPLRTRSACITCLLSGRHWWCTVAVLSGTKDGSLLSSFTTRHRTLTPRPKFPATHAAMT